MNFKNYLNISLFIEAYEGAYTDQTTTGLASFIYHLTDAYPELEPHIDFIRKFILDSGCKKIELKKFKGANANGMALPTGVIINPRALEGGKEMALYTIFHEIAHQYQYKKYGVEKIYGLYIGEIDETEAVKFLRKIELVADEYAIRKCRELAKFNILNLYYIPKEGNYKHLTENQFRDYLNMFRGICKRNNVTDHEKISELFYNYIVNGVEL